LLLREDLDTLTLDQPRELVMSGDQDNTRLAFAKLYPVRAAVVCAGMRGDRLGACWVELADVRRLFHAVPVNRAYNLRAKPGSTTYSAFSINLRLGYDGGSEYFSATMNGSAAWTWSEVCEDLWSLLPAAHAGDYPGLPFTPNGAPEGLDFYGGRAWQALGEVLDRIGCAVRYNPFADTFSIVRTSGTDDAADALLTRLDKERIWDAEPMVPARLRLPEYVRVQFPKLRLEYDETGDSPFYVVDVADLTPNDNSEEDTYAILRDDLSAIYDADGALTNGAALTTRAAERAADWYRRSRQDRRARVYTGLRDILPGPQISAVTWAETGKGFGPSSGFKTIISSVDGDIDPSSGEVRGGVGWEAWDAPADMIRVTADAPSSRIVLPPDDGTDGYCGEIRSRERFIIKFDCNTYTWIVYCECFTGSSGGGSEGGGYCVPGVCLECDEAPWLWTIEASGFTGECDIFNRVWILVNVDACTWKAGSVVNGVGATCTLVLDPGGNTITFEGYASSGELVSSTFTNDASDLPDCCVPLVFDSDVCECDAADTTGDLTCDNCTDTPSLWYLELSDFTGCYSRFNNGPTFEPFVLSPSRTQNCVWEYVNNGIVITWQIGPSGGILTLEDQLQAPDAAATYSVADLALDCCSDLTPALVSAYCGSAGEAPATVSLSPHCFGDTPTGDCPATLTATPTCCDDLPPDEPTCDCPPCPSEIGMPTRWAFIQVACTGEFFDANGIWSLVWDSVCRYTQTRGDVTATLDYDASRGPARAWMLEFTNGTSYQRLFLYEPWLCCGDNLFLVGSGINDHQGVGRTDDFALLTPDGPCSPCEGDPGTLSTVCCPDDLLPTTLLATPADGTGGCACMNAVAPVTLTFNVLNGSWEGTYTGCGGVVSMLRLTCQMLGWRLTYLDAAGINQNAGCCSSLLAPSPAAPSSVSCRPFGLIFPAGGLSPPPGCCLGQFNWYITRV